MTKAMPFAEFLDGDYQPGGIRADIDLVARVQERSGRAKRDWDGVSGWHDLWNDDQELLMRTFPHGSMEMLDLLSDGHGGALHAEFETIDDSSEMRVSGSGQESGISSLERDFDFDDRTAHLKKLYLHDSAQGTGKGLRILLGTYEACRRLGFRAMNLYAFETGTYVWAKAGFICYTWDAVRQQIAQAGEAVIAKLPAEIRREVGDILADNNDKAMWRLADLDHEIKTPAGPMKLGKALLLLWGKPWHGTFDLDDPDCVRRLKEYAKSRGAA